VVEVAAVEVVVVAAKAGEQEGEQEEQYVLYQQ
jgi:hypothetical protein